MANEFKQYVLPDVAPLEALETVGGQTYLQQGSLQSQNYVPNNAGWTLNDDGSAEFQSATIAGTINVGSLNIPDADTTANSFHVNTAGDTWWGATTTDFNANNDNATAYVLKTGVAKFQNVALIGASSTIDGKDIAGYSSVVDDGATPAAPTGLTATAGVQSVFLKWTKNSESDISHYEVWRHTADDSGAASKVGDTKTNMQYDSGLTSGTAYYYWVKAVDRLDNTSGFNSGTTTATPRDVAGSDVQAGAIDTTEIADNAITTGKIAANTIEAGDIAAGTITATEIASNTITANEMNVSQLSAIAADMGTLTSGTITLDSTGHIKAGQTTYDSGTGFFLGQSSGVKFSIGNSAGNKLTWDGSTLNVVGTISASATVNAPIVRSFEAGEDISANDAVCIRKNTHSIDFVAASSQGAETTTNFSGYGTAAVTVEFWVKTNATNNTNDMVVCVNDATAETFQFYRQASDYVFRVRTSSTADSPTIAASTIEDGTWHHVAGTYDGSNIRVYLDGVEQGSGTAHTGNINSSNAAKLGVAHRPAGPDLYWDGQLDEIRVWNVARTEAQIDANKAAEIADDETGLTFYWKCNNATTDETGNYTISLVNAPSYTTDAPDIGSIKIYKTDANDAITTDSFVGFSKAAITSGNSGNVVVSGTVTGFSTLEAGGRYYLSDTAGAISTTAGTVTRKAAIAISPSELLITNIW